MRNDQGSDLLIQFIYGTSPECIALTTQGQVAWRIPAQITYVFGVMEAGDFLPDPGDELVLVEGNARLRVVNGRGEVIRRYLLPPECETAEWTMRRRPEDGAVCLAVNAAQNGGAIVLETGEYRTFDWLLHTANSLSHDLGPAVAVDPSVAYDREEFITVRGEWAMLVDSKGKIHDAVEVPGLWLLRQGNGSALCILSDVGGKRVPYYVKVRAGD